MKVSLLGALNSLKIEYGQVETPKYPRPCTLACNCKIIWASDSGQVGGLPRKFQSYPFGEASRKSRLNFKIFQGNLFKNFLADEISKSWLDQMRTRSSEPSKPPKRSQAVRTI